ncbi:MAG TPA: type 4a pilus biogenesis protein PilO [Polyangiaceae bacterium]|jgi:type IV pilus assembly protein PilO|nr:type 4a pilus biogenesis protein PilO [Polyangiaceae bacterium]
MAAAKKSTLGRLGLPGRIGIGVVLLALPLAVYFIIFDSEIQSEIDAAANKNQKLQFDLKQAQAAEALYQQDLQELAERERNKRELMKVLPVSTEYPAFLSAIQSVANLVGVELRAWTPLEEVPEEFYARVPMKVELGGRFHQIAKFLYNVGQLERIINMENLSITLGPATDQETVLNVSVLATAFHALDESAAAGNPEARRRRDR